MTNAPGRLYCQVCGALNAGDREYCARCQQKLLVVSGTFAPEEVRDLGEADPDDSFSFDEHLLERISILEEGLKRNTEALQQLLDTLRTQERSILVNHAGWASLRDLLEQKRLIGGEEWRELWAANVEHQLGVLDRRRRFSEIRARAIALYRGKRPDRFQELLDDVEHALLDFDVERALESLAAAWRLDRRNAPLALFIGETLFNQGDSREALDYFRRVLAAESDHYEALVYTAVIHHEAGNAARAVELLERAAARFPDSFLPHFSLGMIQADRGRLDLAVESLERAVVLDPVPQALFFLGKCHYERGERGPAVRHLEAAIRKDPRHDEAHLLLGLAYLDRNWRAKALEAFRQALELQPRRMRYQDLVRYLSGQETAPLARLRGAAADWLSRAEAHLERGHPERAIDCLWRALAEDPEHPAILLSYAVTCLELGRRGESERAARSLLELDEERDPDGRLRATAYATLMSVLRRDGRQREGSRVGRRLLETATSNFAQAIVYHEMAASLAEIGDDLDDALVYARRALEVAPDELKGFPLDALGWVHYQRGELGEAVSCLSRAAELWPSPTSLTHLGMALLAAGEGERARQALSEARRVGGRGVSLEQRMMEFLRDSRRLLERVQAGSRPGRSPQTGASARGTPRPAADRAQGARRGGKRG